MRNYSNLMCGLLFLLMLPFFLSNADASIDPLKKITRSPFLQADFDQTRQLQGISFALKSRGNVVILQGIGVYIETRHPIFQASSFSSEGMTDWHRDGTILANQNNNNMADKFVSQLLLALLSGNQKALERIFSITQNTAINKNQWQLTLTPRNSLINKYVNHIYIYGDKYIRNIRIASGNGDDTSIVFSHFTELTENQARKFCDKFPDSNKAPCFAQ